MYNNTTDCKSENSTLLSPGASGLANKAPEVKMLSVIERFKEQNNYAEDVISSITSRLNTIYIRQGEKPDPQEKIPELIVNCAVDELNSQLIRQYKNNKALSDILLHLKEII